MQPSSRNHSISTSSDDTQIVYRTPKSRRQEIRGTFQTYHGHTVASIRVYWCLGKRLPTPNGISVGIDQVPKLYEAVQGLTTSSPLGVAEGEQRLVYAFARNMNDEVRAYWSPFNGQWLAHVRVWTADENDVDRPTKKGLAVVAWNVPKLEGAATALLETFQARGRDEVEPSRGGRKEAAL